LFYAKNFCLSQQTLFVCITEDSRKLLCNTMIVQSLHTPNCVIGAYYYVVVGPYDKGMIGKPLIRSTISLLLRSVNDSASRRVNSYDEGDEDYADEVE
jgi:hypothetical protein